MLSTRLAGALVMKYKNRFNFVTLIFSAFITINANANPSQNKLSPVALFHRCYSHLTGLKAQENNPLLIKVKNSEITAVGACMQVLEKANLVDINLSNLSTEEKNRIVPTNVANSYLPRVIKDKNDSEALAVLETFHSLHRQFFTIQDLNMSPSRYTIRHNDPTEPALFITRLLFEENAVFSDVVSGTYSVRGLRSLGPWVRNFYTGGSTTVNLTIPGTSLDRGVLLGIGAYSTSNSSWMTDAGNLVSNLAAFDFNGPPNHTFQSQRSYGGGIMGLHSYIDMNSGFANINAVDNISDPTEFNTGVSNASRRMMRRWSNNVFRDLLCRQAPLLRTTDVTNLVSSYIQVATDQSKQLPFRVSAGCMSCHAALDPMAATVRALYYKESLMPWATSSEAINDFNPTFRITFLTKYSSNSNASSPTLMPAETPLNGEYSNMLRDPYFYRRPSTGDLRYRSYDGSLIWQHFTATSDIDGLQKMGDWMAQNSNDLYICAASRYMKFFTGIEINLQDPGDPRYPSLSADDQYYKSKAIEFGMNLKTSQSLRGLIRDIISSDIYQKRGMRDLAP
jgi:hypothetical protein